VRECRCSGNRSSLLRYCIANKLTVTAMFKSAFRVSPLKLLPLLLLLIGCGSQQNSSQPAPIPIPVPAAKHGMVQGGQEPVSGATIQLYSVGTTGDGSASTALLSPAPVTDANGAFNIFGTYTCPSSSSLVYIVASGGNPGLASGTNNPALVLMAALGPCGTLTASTNIFINELTTLAAVYSLAPYMTSPSAIGSSSTDAAALTNAFTLASEFVNTANGTTPGAAVPTGTIVPVSQINTIGDILAPCIDSVGGIAGDNSACGNLFALTTPLTGATPPTNTITALLNLANNPTGNTASLYSLIAANNSPFQPTQPQTPVDLSVRLTVPSGFTVSSSTLNFPATRVGSTQAPQSITFTNNTPAPIAVDFAQLTYYDTPLTGANPGDFQLQFATDREGCPTPVLPGASCTLQFAFVPTATGPRSAYLTLHNTSANPYISVLFTGVGLENNAGPASLSTTSLSFTSAGTPTNVTLTNSGTTALTIDGITISNDPTSGQPAFTQTSTCATSLAPQATCTITVSAVATAQLYSTGVLTVGDDAAAGPQTLNLSYSNGFAGPILIDFGSRSVGTQGANAFNFQPSGLPSGANSLTLTGADATDFSFQSGSSSQTGSCTTSRSVFSCIAPVYFTPAAVGVRTATLNFNGTPYGGVIGSGLTAGLHFFASPGSIDFSGAGAAIVVIGQTSPAISVVVTNTGTVALTLNAPALGGVDPSDFGVVSNCTTLAPNATCTLTVTASPTQPANRSATLTLTDSTGTAQQTLSLKVIGSYPPPVVNPNTISFAYTPLGTASAAQSFTVTSYNNDPVTVTLVDAQLMPFVLTQTTCTSTPCEVSVGFAPTTANTTAGNGTTSYGDILVSDLFSELATLVSVSGLYQPLPASTTTASISPLSLTFPLDSVGTTSSAAGITIANTGNQPLTLAISLTGNDPQDFFMSSCQSTMIVGGQCGLIIEFSPTATGLRTASIQITTNATNLSSPVTISLSGTAQ
jgi:trimeric autotransporter adhesin